MEDWKMFALLVGVGFVAGIINTMAGGGSLLTLPVLIFLGIPPQVANATNRIGIFMNASMATAGFKSKGVFNFPFNLYLGISALAGSLIGAQFALDIKGALFNKVLSIIMVVVLLLIIFKPKAKKILESERLTGKYLVYSIIGFFFIGIYGGFINAGIGFVIMLFLNNVNRLSLVKTNATKVSLVAIYTLGALIYFAYHGAVNWKAGIFLGIGMGIGAWFTSRWSVKKGDKAVKIFLIISIVLMSAKLWFF